MQSVGRGSGATVSLCQSRPCVSFQHSGIRDDVTLQFSTVPWVVFRGDPRPDDIRQGGVGNCWFVCALSCLAEYPLALQKVILTPAYNPAGAYQVRLCCNGNVTVM